MANDDKPDKPDELGRVAYETWQHARGVPGGNSWALLPVAAQAGWTAAAAAVLEAAGPLAVMIADLEGFIARRAEELAAPLIAEAAAEAARHVQGAEAETRRQQDLAEELRRQVAIGDRTAFLYAEGRDKLAAALGYPGPAYTLAILVDEAATRIARQDTNRKET